MKKLIIFDLDGTLLNTLEDIKLCVNIILAKYGFPLIDLSQTRRFVGNGARKLMERAVGKSTDNFEKIFGEYVELQKNCDNKNTFLYEGLSETLIELKKQGYLLAIVSNKPDNVTQEVYKNKLSVYEFDYVLGNRPEEFSPKPDKACVIYTLDKLGIDKSEALYVGDSEVDVKTFINASIDGIGVLWGFRDRKELEEAGCVNFVYNAVELLEKINSFN